jgi:hypothetical protein
MVADHSGQDETRYDDQEMAKPTREYIPGKPILACQIGRILI